MQLECELENLGGSGYDQLPISAQTLRPPDWYNCIAYAAGHMDAWWWPDPKRFLYYWPPHLPRELPGWETSENFIRAFEWKGYKVCENGSLEVGIEKVVIFLKNNRPTHAARQLESGVWTSKCGRLEDIQHAALAAVEGRAYGQALIFLCRRRVGKPI
jgi:hypothetical protein